MKDHTGSGQKITHYMQGSGCLADSLDVVQGTTDVSLGLLDCRPKFVYICIDLHIEVNNHMSTMYILQQLTSRELD